MKKEPRSEYRSHWCLPRYAGLSGPVTVLKAKDSLLCPFLENCPWPISPRRLRTAHPTLDGQTLANHCHRSTNSPLLSFQIGPILAQFQPHMPP